MPFHPRNYSRGDVSVAETTVMLLAAFAKTGDPSPKNTDKHDSVNWPEYDLNTQQYLSIGNYCFHFFIYIIEFI